MHRFYYPKPELKAGIIEFDGPEWHHCQTVLRARVGERVTLFDGEGNEFLAEVTLIQEKSAKLRVLQKSATPRAPYAISLAQALPKHKAMDMIVQKATELGVREIYPVISERSVIQLESEEAANKLARWNEISIESAKQCGLNWLPVIHPLKSVRQITELRASYQKGFIGSLQPDALPFWKYVDAKAAAERFLLMIGPEGDFTPAELSLARSSNFQPLSLGPLVLRCDTAAIYALSTMSYELRRLQ